MIEITLFVCGCIILLMLIIPLIIVLQDKKRKKEQKNKQNLEYNYSKPQLKPLTEEQIEEIHSRGKITPYERVKEWESMDLCAPGDAIGSAAWRCRKFRYCCHDCLVDYANEHDEYTSMFEIMKKAHYKIHNDN